MNVSYCFIKEKWYDYLAHYCEPTVYYGLPYYYVEEDEEEAEDGASEDIEEDW